MNSNKKHNLLGWILGFTLCLGMVFNNMGVVNAQDITDTPTETPTPTSTETFIPTSEPSDTAIPTLTEIVATETPTPTLATTTTPTETSTPTLTETIEATPSNALPLDESSATIAYHSGTGKVSFIGSDPNSPIENPALQTLDGIFAMSESGSPEEAARGFLTDYGDLFGLTDQAAELSLISETQPDETRSIVRFQQNYQGIPVFAGELVIQLDLAGNVISANGEILPDISVSTSPVFSMEAAQQIAITMVSDFYQVAEDQLTANTPELWVYNPVLVSSDNGLTSLVWKLEITPNTLLPIDALVLVNAETGSVELQFNQSHGAKAITVYTAGNTTAIPGTVIPNCDQSLLTCGSDGDAQSAALYASDFYNFFKNYNNRDSFDNGGSAIISTVNYGAMGASPNVYAWWNGGQVIYGDAASGIGYSRADDIVAHELTHGVTQYTSNLFNYYQSGAISESLSDMWGEFIDLTNAHGNDAANVRWLIGEDNPGGAVRSMTNPPLYSQPDKMTSTLYYKGISDNGGIYTNSGINNKAVVLLTDGGTFNGITVTGIGITKVEAIYYEAQTNLLVSGADYADLFNIMYQACFNIMGHTLYGTTSKIVIADCVQVRNAVTAVEMNKQVSASFNQDAPYCAATTMFTTDSYTENFESGTGSWQTTGSSWSYDTQNPHSGVYSYYANDTAVNANSSLAMKNSTLIPANSFLYFSHDYNLEDGKDGGIVEYSTNGTVWQVVPAGWILNNSYIKAVEALGSQSGFTGTSHGYTSSRIDLSTLAGQNIYFRWRLATNGTGHLQGWWVDDIKIYTCHATFSSVTRWSQDFNSNQGWTVVLNPRMVGDINNDGYGDIVGFGGGGVWVTLNNQAGGFGPVTKWSSDLTYDKGWRTTKDVRVLGDVNGDGRDDLVGFGDGGVWVAKSNGTSFLTATRWTTDFSNIVQGWTVTQHIRTVGDVNGDGRDDLIGFGSTGVWVALSTGTSFSAVSRWSTEFNLNQGWLVDVHPRVVGDINGDGKADVVGFGANGIWIAISTGTGFNPVQMWSYDLTYTQGWRVDKDIRLLGDVNADGMMDVVGFGSDGISVALSTGSSFGPINLWSSDFSAIQGWTNAKNIRTVGDVNHDGKADMLGFGDTGVWVSTAN